jgi:hypothetical protein
MATAPTIELLFWRECPSWERALAELREALSRAGLDPDAIDVREVATNDMAESQRFIGSPTIRIDGEDVQPPGEEEPLGLACRIYRLRDGRVSPLPDRADVREAIARALSTAASERS